MSWCHIYYITSVILYIYNGYVTASEYYVSAAPNGEDCPSGDLPCQDLSYYIADYPSYFIDDAIFYFLEGTHTLQGILNISNVSNITLQGLGHIEQGFHETVMQSTSVIRCSNSKRTGIQFTSSSDVELKSLTIANCGFKWNQYPSISLYFADNDNITLEFVSVQNSSSIGLFFLNTYDVQIDSSSFANNGAPETLGSNVNIKYNDKTNRQSSVIILKSNLTLGLGGGIYFRCSDGNKAIVFIENSMFSSNKAWSGGGIEIFSHGDTSIEFSNCIICSNTAHYGGGGVNIHLDGDGSIEFSDTTICNNTARFGGGGLSIDLDEDSSIKFSNCIIYNNIVQYGGGGVDIGIHGSGSIEISNCTISNSFAQIGGGLYMDLHGNGRIEIYNCNIYNNTAQVDGGGVRMFSLGGGSIEFINCTIYDNTAQSDGGGMYIDLYAESGSIVFSNCTIYDNTAQIDGGGMYINSHADSCSIDFNNCTISNNTANFASGLVLLSFRTTSSLTRSFQFTNISFHFNKVSNKPNAGQKGYQSVITLMNVDNVTFDQLKVSNHNTIGLVGVNSLITFDGQNKFVNNSGIYGGGIALYNSSQLLLKQYTNITFVNNHASKSGGGIFVYRDQVLGVDIATECSFKVIPYHYPNDTKTVLYFVNNRADISGDVLYGDKIDNCTNTLYFDYLFNYPQQTGLSAVSSDPIQVCFCQTNRPNCSITSINILITPGINIDISLATVGILDGLTQGVIKLNSSDNSSIVQYHNNRLNAVCTNVTFTLKINPSLNTTQVYATLNSSIIEPLYDPYAKVLEVTIESCLIGFPLKQGKCACRSELNAGSITCDINTQIITRNGDMWIGYENDSNCLIVYPNCPFHYCNDNNISFTFNSSSKQCLHNRSGILCGQCDVGFSLMLGYNQCEQCSNDYLALIIPFAVAGIALVVFVTVLNLTVSVGTINGLIFYANVVKMYEHMFFPEHSLNFLSQFISWINLDLGIKTCFYHNMDSCSKMWLQFLFPAYVWVIIIIIIILLRYSSKLVRLVGRQTIPVLATMILLSYTKLIRTVFQVLYSIKIPCTDVNNNTITLLMWHIDANVQYVRGCHIPLFLFSLAVLFLLIVPYTFYLLTIPLFEGPLSKYMCCCQKLSTYMKPFFDAYGGPYKDKCRFWTGFLLLVRVILASVVSLGTEATASLDVLTSLLIVIIFMHYIFKGIYRHFPLGFLEEFFIFNLMFMAYMNAQTSNHHYDSKEQVSNIVLVSISFAVFCGIIFYHVWDRLIFYHVRDHLSISCLQQQITKVKNIFKKPPSSSTSNDLELSLMDSKSPIRERKSTMSVVSVEMKRESILFDTNDYY